MKYFIMNVPQTPDRPDLAELPGRAWRPGCDLSRDEAGRLYDARTRNWLRSQPLPEGLSPEGAEALAALRFASKAMRHQTDRWADQHDLSEGRLHLLFRLRRAPGHQLALHLLANVLDVSPRNITGLVDHLEKDGLIERVPDSEDRRSIHARLTAAALKRMDQLWKESTGTQVSLLQGFSKEELNQFRDFCYRLMENMAKAGATPGSKEERQ